MAKLRNARFNIGKEEVRLRKKDKAICKVHTIQEGVEFRVRCECFRTLFASQN